MKVEPTRWSAHPEPPPIDAAGHRRNRATPTSRRRPFRRRAARPPGRLRAAVAAGGAVAATGWFLTAVHMTGVATVEPYIAVCACLTLVVWLLTWHRLDSWVDEVVAARGQTQPIVVYGFTVSLTARTVFAGQLAHIGQRGFKTFLITSPDAQLSDFAEAEGVEVLALPMTRGLLGTGDLRSVMTAARGLWTLRPDVICFSTPKAAFLLGLASFVSRVPVRVYLMAGLRLEGERPGSLRYHVLHFVEYVTCRCAHVVLMPSESLRTRALSTGVVRPDKATMLGRGSVNGVDLERFRPATAEVRRAARADYLIDSRATVFGFVGRVVADKGISTLIEAFDTLPESLPAVLLMVGDLEEGHGLPPAVVERIRNDSRIRLTGFVDDTTEWYRLMDVLVLPSRREGLPTVALEAAACGIPVITTDATGCRDAVEDQVTGLVVPAGDQLRLAVAMERLAICGVDREHMGLAGRRWVEQHFDSHVVWSRTGEFLEDLIDACSPAQR